MMLPSLTWSQLLSPVSIISSLLLPAVCMTGDHLLSTKFIRSNMYRRALTDSVTHGIIGGVSWMVVLGESALSRSGVTQFFLGFILASVVDVDHFIMARSLKLQDALTLPHRPPLHNSSLIPVIALFIYIIQRILRCNTLPYFPLMFMLCWLSHHVRDAVRRGLWMGPFFTTSALPYQLYILLIMLLPWIFKFVYLTWILPRDKSVVTVKHEPTDII